MEQKAQKRPEGWTKITVETEGEAPDVVETNSYFVAAITDRGQGEVPVFVVRAMECSTVELPLLYAAMKEFEKEIEKLNPRVKPLYESAIIDTPDIFQMKEVAE